MNPDSPQFNSQPSPQYPPQQPLPPMPPMQPPVTVASPEKSRNPLLIPLIIALVFLLGALGFGFWAFTERSDYKNNSDQKAAAAVEKAVAESKAAQEAEFLVREKEPLKSYRGPEALGSVEIQYPKTWSAFVTESGSRALIDGYFHPGFVPGIDSGTAFALRLEVLEEDYNEILKEFESASRKGQVKISAVSPKNVSNIAGSRIDGVIEKDRRGSVVLFPMRDKTLRLTAQSESYVKDFNNIILENLRFIP